MLLQQIHINLNRRKKIMRDVSRFNIRSEEVNKAPKDKFTANNLLGCLYGKKCQFIPITRTENRQSAYFQCVAYST